MADLQSVFGSINITIDDKNKYLRVDNNYNPSWETITQESIGDSWVYTQFSKPTIVNLPKLSDSIGGIVAIMRNDASVNNPAYIAIRPYDLSEQIMGKEGCWVNTVKDENFASVVLKAVNYVDDTGKTVNMWTIVNGVNTWEQVAYDISSVPEFASAQDQNVFVQKIGANALSGGVGASGVEYKAIGSTVTSITVEGRENPFTIPSSFKFNKSPDITAGDNQSTVESYYLTPYNSDNTLFVVGLDNTQSNPNWKYINSYTSFDNTCMEKALGQTSIGATAFNTLQQCIFSLNLDSIILSDNTALTSIDKLYLYIEPYADTSNDVIKMFKTGPNVKEDAKTGNIDYGQIIPLGSNGNAITTPDQTNIGSIVSVPISDSDIANNKITFVIEIASSNGLTDAKTYIKFKLIGVEQTKSISVSPDIDFSNFGMVNCQAIGTYETDKSYEKQYISAPKPDEDIIKYGASTVNLDKYFDSTETFKSLLKTFTSTFTGISPIRVDASGEYNVNDYKTIFNTTADSLTDQDKNIIKLYNANTLFDKNGNYIPDKSVTKTVIEYKLNGKLTGSTSFVHLDNARLEIDWNSKTFIFNGTLYDSSNKDYLASLVGKFNDSNTNAHDVIFYNTADEKITLKQSLQISALTGLSRLPYCYAYGDNSSTVNKDLEFQLNITNYKTVYKNENLNLKYFEELIHYRCGWERAEDVWTTTPATDGSEWDALNGKSKECIEPAHRKQIETAVGWDNRYNPTKTSNIITETASDKYNDTFDSTKTALLPYYAWLEGEKTNTASCHYWALRPIGPTSYNNKLEDSSALRAFSNVPNVDSTPAAINQFCNLIIKPTISGTLFVDISLPFMGIYPSQLATLVLKEKFNEDGSIIENSMELVYDSGLVAYNDYVNNRANGNIHFTDTAEASVDGSYTKYYILFYAFEGGNTGANTQVHNAIIARRSYNMHWNSEITDFRTFFDAGSKIQYNATNDNKNISMQNIFGTQNNAGSVDESINVNGKGFMERFTNLMFGERSTSDTHNNRAWAVSTKNTGSTFSFHAYVIKSK